jgi:hypothetical protein
MKKKTIATLQDGGRHWLALCFFASLAAALTGCVEVRTGTGRSSLDVLGSCETDNFRIKQALCAGTLDRPGTDPNDFFATLEDKPGTDPNDACRSKYGSKDSYTKALCSCRVENAKLIARITYCDTAFATDDAGYNQCIADVKAHPSVGCP